jgi:hypothetical protein
VSKDHELVKTLEILINETWRSCQEKKVKIASKYEKKLKILSILSCFAGSNTYTLPRLERELGVKREEALNLLVEASISKLVVVHIDEESGRIKIVRAKIREREVK